MKRHRNHVLEDNSVTQFKLLLPEIWNLHTFTKDYGIDVQIEIFDINGESSGLRVYGQLKATDKTEDEDSLSLDKEHFEYWAAHTDPVLLIRYFDKSKSFKWSWMHDIHWRLKPNKKNISVTNYLKNWDEEKTPNEIESFLKLRGKIISGKVTFPVAISVIDNNIGLRGSLEISKKLKSLLPLKGFEVLANPETPCQFNVLLDNKDLCIGHLGLPGYVLSLDMKLSPKIVSELIITLIFLTAWRYDRSLVAKAIAESSTETLLKAIPENLEVLLIESLIYALGVTKTSEILLKNESHWSNPIFLFKLLSVGLRVCNKYRLLDEWYVLLLNWATNPPHKEMGGASAYNYANAIKDNDQWEEALKYYLIAAERDKEYLSRDYYWNEVGAAQFECELYEEASESYQRAYEITPNPQTAWRLGDSLFHSGKYEKAYGTLEKAFSEDQDLGSYPYLVMVLCDDLINFWGIKEQKITAVDDETQNNLITHHPASTVEELVSSLKPLLKICAIDPLLNFNAGHLSRILNQFQISAYRYLTCALRQRGDADAWANALLSAMQAEQIVLVALIVESGYFYVGEELIQAILNIFSLSGANKKTSAELEQSLVDLIRSATQKEDKSSTIRIHGENETKSFKS
jgi:tetratricopeptide (TPR) repeat protein